jgi:hypothetical protein
MGWGSSSAAGTSVTIQNFITAEAKSANSAPNKPERMVKELSKI